MSATSTHPMGREKYSTPVLVRYATEHHRARPSLEEGDIQGFTLPGLNPNEL